MNKANQTALEGHYVVAAQSQRHWHLIFAGCVLLLLLLGWFDYITGYELGFFVFYSMPVGLAAWYIGRWSGIAMAFGATLIWWLADDLNGAKYSSRFSFYWNSTIHFLTFLINAVSIAKIKLGFDERDRLDAQLKSVRHALRETAKFLPVCPVCGKARMPSECQGSAELREMARTHIDFNGALCDQCSPAKSSEGTEPVSAEISICR